MDLEVRTSESVDFMGFRVRLVLSLEEFILSLILNINIYCQSLIWIISFAIFVKSDQWRLSLLLAQCRIKIKFIGHPKRVSLAETGNH